MAKLGPHLRAWRIKRGLTLREAAQAVGVSLNTWWRWEQDHRTPELERWDGIAKALRITVPQLLKPPK